MAFNRGPKIVTNGLMLALDAASKNSYHGTGTVWTDLSGNNNNGTLVNGPTFNSSNGGTLLFNGTNQYISGFTNPVLTNQITAEVWMNIDTSNISGGGSSVASFIIGRENIYRIICGLGGIDFVCATTNNSWYSAGTVVSYSGPLSSWMNVVVTYDGTKLSLYINSVLITTGSAISGNLLTAGGNFNMMQSNGSNVTYGKGNISNARIYNRALNATEVLQNYNAQKSRFNL